MSGAPQGPPPPMGPSPGPQGPQAPQAPQGPQAPQAPQAPLEPQGARLAPVPRRSRHRGGAFAFFAAAILLVLGVVGLGASGAGVINQLLPRRFTVAQQQKIMDWEVAKRWRQLPAGTIFGASITYDPPAILDDTGSSPTLTARRVGIARQASCAAATDSAAAKVLARDGCAALLRATYVEGTDSYVVTVGVAAFPSAARADAAQLSLDKSKPAAGGLAPGVRTVRFAGTPAAGFTDSRRQLTGSASDGSYIVMYAIGYTDDRPRVPVSADSYADAEMTSVGTGVAEAVASVLGASPQPPHCPGAPGC